MSVVFCGAAPFGLGADSLPICKKEIPTITFKNLSPPYKDYDYFENRQHLPFEYAASSFSQVNAWWLAEAATLVYADEAFVRQQFKGAGLDRVEVLNPFGTQCFIAANDRFAIIAFRGSEIWKRNEGFDAGQILADLKTNIDIRLSDRIQGGRVHNGFKTALEDVWDDLGCQVEDLRARGIKIWLTGHSLGAALATLAADRLQTVQGLYTFGSPRVGDQAFKARFQIKAFRVVNGNDIVPSLPPKGPFRHVGELKLIGASDGPDDRRETVGNDHRAPCPEPVSGSGSAQAQAAAGSAELIPTAIRDHVPLLYAISLWNELTETPASAAVRP